MKKVLEKIGKTEIRNILAVLMVLGCFILLFLLQVRPVPKENKDLLNIAVGFVFGGGLAGVIGFYFGSSKNEADKITNKND